MTSPRRRPARPTGSPVRAIGYLRVSTVEQADSGLGLDAQRAALVARAAIEGWQLEVVADEGISGATMTKRPALLAALARLDAGEVDVLVASKLDRVSRSVRDFAGLLDRARDRGWRLVLLDLGVDTSTPAGELVASTIAASAQYERRIGSQRTKDGLAATRARGTRLGRPSSLPAELVARIVAAKGDGDSLRTIAGALDAEGIPTAQGGSTWRASSVQAVLRGQDAAALVCR